MTLYEEALAQGDSALRTVLLDAASRVLAAEGAAALSLRRVAGEVGCSTTVLYRMFGGKGGLAEELYREGFRRFRERLEAVPPGDDPVAHLAELGLAYRRNALAERHYYGLMFGDAIPGFAPGDAAVREGAAAFGVLTDAVAACAAAGYGLRAEPEVVAAQLWATVHGLVSLELAGQLPAADQVVEATMATLAAGMFT